MFLSDGIVMTISLQVEFAKSLTTMSGLFAVIVLSISHMMVMLLSLLCITVSGSCWHNLRHKEGQYPKQVLEIEGPDTHIKI